MAHRPASPPPPPPPLPPPPLLDEALARADARCLEFLETLAGREPDWGQRWALPCVSGEANVLYAHTHFKALAAALRRHVVPEGHFWELLGCEVTPRRAAPEAAARNVTCYVCGAKMQTVLIDGVGKGNTRGAHLSCAVFVTSSRGEDDEPPRPE